MANIVDSSSAKPYDTVGYVLKLARVAVLDASRSIDGDLLAVTQPYMPTILNLAWRRLQDDLIDAGVETLTATVMINGVPPAANSDPGIETFLDWEGYNDGIATFDNVTLPNDMILPSFLWERPTGSNLGFIPVKVRDGGLPNNIPSQEIHYWEWREDKIYMKGAMQTCDLKLRYVKYFPDLADDSLETPIDLTVKVPIMRGGPALAYCLASEFAASRDAAAADKLEAKAQREISRITNRTSRRKQFIQVRRAAFGR